MSKLAFKIKYWSREIAAGLLFIMCLFAFGSILGDSLTMDEIAHIPAGYTYAKFHDYRLNPEHPPLVKMMAGLPLTFIHLTFHDKSPAWTSQVNGQWDVGWEFLYRSGNNPETIALLARLPMLVIMVVMGVFVYLWAKKTFGVYAAIIALFFVVFSPNLIAHSRYVTTDIAASVGLLISLYYYVGFLKNPSWKKLSVAMIGLSIAQLLKFSDVILYPLFFILMFGAVLFRKEVMPKGFFLEWLFKRQVVKRVWVYAASYGLIVLGSFVIIALFYQLSMYATPTAQLHALISGELNRDSARWVQPYLHNMVDNPMLRAFGHWLLGVSMVYLRVSSGNTTYFLGEVSNQSWHSFYPVAILLKTPIATLIWSLFGAGVLGGISIQFLRKIKKSLHESSEKRYQHVWQVIAQGFWGNYYAWAAMMIIVVFLAIGILGNLNIGLRHVLPFYPFWFILLSGVIVWIYRKTKRVTRILFWVVSGVLFVWYVVTSVMAFPHYLSYFNESIGGNENGYKYLVDSNLDWGQDLKRLAQFVEENDINKINVDYFGGGLPSYYLGDRFVEYHSANGPKKGWLAVSATFYQNSKYYGPLYHQTDYSWLDNRSPVTVIGNSILVFYIE